MTADRRVQRSTPRLILASGFQPDYVKEVANAYARNGHSVEVIGGDMHAPLEFEPGVTLLNLRGPDKTEATRIRELFKLARYYVRLLRRVLFAKSRVLYDVSIGRPFLRCLLMYTAFRIAGVRIIYTAHNVLPHDGDNALNRAVFAVIYRVLTSAIVVHGESLKQRLLREFRVNPEKVFVVHHGTYHPADNPTLTRIEARKLLGVPESARVCLIFGLQRPYKGTHFVLDALAAKPIRDLYLLIRGNTTCAEYRHRLTTSIANQPEGLSIDAVLAPVPDQDVEALFKACDVVLLPYLEGSQSGVKFMAYAYGRPVLCSDLGSLAEFIQPGVTGETFSPGDLYSFTSTLRSMLDRLDTYDETEIREIAYSDYSFESAMRQIEGIHCRLARTSGAALSVQEGAT